MRTDKPVVLVVEDTPICRVLACRVVLRAGYEALVAEDVDETIRILSASDDIDLVFTDAQMPGTMSNCANTFALAGLR